MRLEHAKAVCCNYARAAHLRCGSIRSARQRKPPRRSPAGLQDRLPGTQARQPDERDGADQRNRQRLDGNGDGADFLQSQNDAGRVRGHDGERLDCGLPGRHVEFGRGRRRERLPGRGVAFEVPEESGDRQARDHLGQDTGGQGQSLCRAEGVQIHAVQRPGGAVDEISARGRGVQFTAARSGVSADQELNFFLPLHRSRRRRHHPDWT